MDEFHTALRESAFATYEDALAFLEWYYEDGQSLSSWDFTRYEQAKHLESLFKQL
jgi:hypothetical protein